MPDLSSMSDEFHALDLGPFIFMKLHAATTTRRGFLRRATTAVAAVSVVPSYVLGLKGAISPNNKLNIACIGIGGRGADDISGVSRENIVALCDVDARRAVATYKKFPQAKQYQDFRRMLDQVEKQIDAVVVATPDHTHAVALMRAMKMGKHVYSEKPLAHSIHEVRELIQAARHYKVVTQLGNQGHSFDSIRTFVEWIKDGAIGTVREVHALCGSSYGRLDQVEKVREGQPVPDGLDWDLWLGPAQFRPYHSAYVPGRWRGWRPFGTGVLGDWTCHVIDPVFWALELDAPTRVAAETFEYDPKKHFDTFPAETVIRYDFPARGARPAVKVTWYDGGQRPPRPEELEPGKQLPDTGAMVVGDKGKILYGSHGAGNLRLIPASRMQAYQKPAPTIPRSPGHYEEWIAACKNGQPAGSNFNYGGPLTEVALVGAIATLFKDQQLEWNSQQARFTNCPEANQYIDPPYRRGWNL